MWTCSICIKTFQCAGGHPRTHNPNFVGWNKGLTKKSYPGLSGGAPREKLLGNKNHLGKPMSEDAKRRISEKSKGRKKSINHKKKLSESLSQSYIDGMANLSRFNRHKHSSEEKLIMKERAIEQWKEPNHAKKVFARKEISGPEKDFKTLCIKNNLPFKFVGHGDLVIEGKNPDFVHESKQKLIEIYGEFYHKDQNPQDRIDFFKERGWDCLVFWASELNQSNLINRIREYEQNK